MPEQRSAALSAAQTPATAAAAITAPHDDAPSGAGTLIDVLRWHLHKHPDQTQVICLEGDTEHAITYRGLATSAAAIAAGLQRLGVRPRECVAIMLPTSPEYFGTYFGILLAGAVPVPIYPPARWSQLEDHVLRHTGILANAQACVLVTVPEAMVVARLLQARVPGLRHVVTAQQLTLPGAALVPVTVRGEDIAFIQYTSGSTGNPKGVALTHANLLANIRSITKAAQATPRDTFVSWLPLYHDMGLIGAWLAPLYVGFPTVVMSPLAFLARPLRWLEMITRYRGSLSAAPNFAYELCLKHVTEVDAAGLDLSRWRLAFNGAEAVSPDTVQRFRLRFARCGLRAEAIAPVYGLAEACVGLLFPPLGRAPLVDRIQRDPLTRGCPRADEIRRPPSGLQARWPSPATRERAGAHSAPAQPPEGDEQSGKATFAHEHRAVPAAADDPTALRFVACGRPIPGHAVRIVDDAGVEVAERVEGRLEFSGPSATRGYYRNPELSARLFHDGWLDTGDRAYKAGGDVYITGRVKDIIIRGGRNLYPQEIEDAVGAVDGVRKGGVAVFGSPDPASEPLLSLHRSRTRSANAIVAASACESRWV